jgi:aryl-alcohol dehydrogenase-like predicted oxidoreductase
LDASLRALRVERIDLYQFHSGSDEAFENEALWAMLDGEKRAGKIGHLGISILGKGSPLQAREARRVGAEALQVVYNRLDRRPEELYFPHAERGRLGILARVPLASGLLSGKYRPGTSFPPNDVRARFDQEKMRNDTAEAARIQKEEVPPGVPMAQWALAWCLSNSLVSAVIPGCKDPAQVTSNAAAADLLAA